MHNVKYIGMGIVVVVFALVFVLACLSCFCAFYHWAVELQGWRDLCLFICYGIAACVIVGVIWGLGWCFRTIGRAVLHTMADDYTYDLYMKAEANSTLRKDIKILRSKLKVLS